MYSFSAFSAQLNQYQNMLRNISKEPISNNRHSSLPHFQPSLKKKFIPQKIPSNLVIPPSGFVKRKFKNYKLINKSNKNVEFNTVAKNIRTSKGTFINPSINDIRLAEIDPDLIGHVYLSQGSTNISQSPVLKSQPIKEEEKRNLDNSINQSSQINKEKQLIVEKKKNLKVLQIETQIMSPKKSVIETTNQQNLTHIDTFTYNIGKNIKSEEEIKNNSPLPVKIIPLLEDESLKKSPQILNNNQKVKMLTSIFINNNNKVDKDKIQLYLALYGPKKLMLNQEEINSVEKTPLNMRNPEFNEASFSNMAEQKINRKSQFFPDINEINISKQNVINNLSVSNLNTNSKYSPLSLASPRFPKTNNLKIISEKEDNYKYNQSYKGTPSFKILGDNDVSSFNYNPIINPLLISGSDSNYKNQDPYKTSTEFKAKDSEGVSNIQFLIKGNKNNSPIIGANSQCFSNNASIDKNEDEPLNNLRKTKFDNFSMKNWTKINKNLQRKFSQEFIKTVETKECLGNILPLKFPECKKEFLAIKNYFNLTRPKFLKRRIKPKHNKETIINEKGVNKI